MRKVLFSAAALGLAMATMVHADGDPAAGEKVFQKCKACHSIVNGDTVIQNGGKVGPNLYGVIGRPAASVEGFRYGDGIIEAGKKGLVWNQDEIAVYVQDPSAFLEKFTGDPQAKSHMTFKLPKGGEDVAAYLASVGPAAK